MTYESTACEGSTLELHCPGESRILVTEGFYGRRDSTVCTRVDRPSSLQETCSSDDALQIAKVIIITLIIKPNIYTIQGSI